jgi:hypothetical protein
MKAGITHGPKQRHEQNKARRDGRDETLQRFRASAMTEAFQNVFVPANMRLGENAGANVQRIIDYSI